MTAAQMSTEFEIGYDFITNFEAPGINPRERSFFLTQAQEELVHSIYRGDKDVEFNKKILNMLKTTNNATSFAAGPYPNSFWCDLPANLMIVINDRLKLTSNTSHFYPSTVFDDVKVIPIDDDYYNDNKDNPYKRPDNELGWRLDYAEDDSGFKRKHVYVIEANQVLTTAYIHYYRKPEPIIVLDATYVAGDGAIDGKNFSDYTATELPSELDPLVHRAIVERAIKLAYAALQDDKGFQLSSAKEQAK
jgi:hypothetical protein